MKDLVFSTFVVTRHNTLILDEKDMESCQKFENSLEDFDKKDFPHYFKVEDDDGNIYFWGYSNDDCSFDPVDDYGEAMFGAPWVFYKGRKSGKWELL